MPELWPAGYRWLRARVFERWGYLGIFDSDGREIARLNCASDPRIARTIDDANGEVITECRIRGDDPEFAARLPVRVAATALFPHPAGGEFRSRVSYAPAALAAATDGAILRHRCHIPRDLLAEVY